MNKKIAYKVWRMKHLRSLFSSERKVAGPAFDGGYKAGLEDAQKEIDMLRDEAERLRADIERKDMKIAELKNWLARASSHALKEIDNE